MSADKLDYHLNPGVLELHEVIWSFNLNPLFEILLAIPKQVDCFSETHETVAVGKKGDCCGSCGKMHEGTFLCAV